MGVLKEIANFLNISYTLTGEVFLKSNIYFDLIFIL